MTTFQDFGVAKASDIRAALEAAFRKLRLDVTECTMIGAQHSSAVSITVYPKGGRELKMSVANEDVLMQTLAEKIEVQLKSALATPEVM